MDNENPSIQADLPAQENMLWHMLTAEVSEDKHEIICDRLQEIIRHRISAFKKIGKVCEFVSKAVPEVLQRDFDEIR